jgi:hypothetical protein
MSSPVAAPSVGVLNRRSLIAGAAAAALLAGVPSRASGETLRASAPDAGRAAAASPANGVITTAELIRGNPFYIAHRGGGRNWPQLTAYAYSQAVQVPNLRALEISVCISSDGVLVCSHDKFTTASTGVPYRIIEQTWETLSSLEVLPTGTLDPSQPARPFTRFEDVVERYIDDYVLFVEPKVSSAAGKLMKRMTDFGQPDRVVWKQPVNSPRFAAAKQQGFSTWGYVLDEPSHTGANLQRLAASPDIDLLGAYNALPDVFVSDVVAAAQANDKLTIAWAIGSVAQRDRMLDLGCSGMMTSDAPRHNLGVTSRQRGR